MAVIYNRTYSSYVDEEREICCAYPAYRHSTQYQQTIETLVTRPTDHRIRPIKFWLSKTAQSTASRTLLRPAITCREVTQTCTSTGCTAIHRRIYRSLLQPPAPPVMPAIVFPTSEYNSRVIAEIQSGQVRIHRSVAQVDKAAALLLEVVKIAAAGIGCATGSKKSCVGLTQYALWVLRHSVMCLLPKNFYRCWANAALAINFGMKPLALSLQACANEITNGAANNVIPINLTFSQRDEQTVNGWLWVQETRWYVKASVYAYPTASGDFHFGTVEEWTWERIPFSFVVDWMIPVGEYIAAKSTLQEVGFFAGTISTVTTLTGRRIDPIPYTGQKVWLDDPGAYEKKSHTRTMATKPGMPTMWQFKPTKSLTSLTNAIALLIQLRTGKL